jgi:WD40 repeat protein
VQGSNQSDIRHLASSSRSIRVAAADYDGTVSVWDLETRKRLSYFETPLDFGGRRLAISPRGNVCSIASWAYNGVACYDAQTGEVVWARQKLKMPQYLIYAPDGTRLYCAGERRPCAVLDADTGADITSHPRTDNVYCSDFQPLVLLEKRVQRRLELRQSGSRLVAVVSPITFAILDAAFGPDSFCLTESGGPVRCIETADGTERWRYTPANGKHVLAVGYSRAANAFFGIEWSYEKGGAKQLLHFDSDTGKRSLVARIDILSATELFCQSGDALLTSTGALIDVLTGESRIVFRFPKVRR